MNRFYSGNEYCCHRWLFRQSVFKRFCNFNLLDGSGLLVRALVSALLPSQSRAQVADISAGETSPGKSIRCGFWRPWCLRHLFRIERNYCLGSNRRHSRESVISIQILCPLDERPWCTNQYFWKLISGTKMRCFTHRFSEHCRGWFCPDRIITVHGIEHLDAIGILKLLNGQFSSVFSAMPIS